MTVKAYGARAADKPLESLDITRRAPGAHDVQIDIDFCGVCHSDLHTVRAEWAGTLYPCVPGHEIVGRVSAAGAPRSDACAACAATADGTDSQCTRPRKR